MDQEDQTLVVPTGAYSPPKALPRAVEPKVGEASDASGLPARWFEPRGLRIPPAGRRSTDRRPRCTTKPVFRACEVNEFERVSNSRGGIFLRAVNAVLHHSDKIR